MDLTEMGWRVWTEFIWLRIGTIGGSCEHHNAPLISIKCWEFLECAEQLLGFQGLSSMDLVSYGHRFFSLHVGSPSLTQLAKHETDHSSLMPKLRLCECSPTCPLFTFKAWHINIGRIFIANFYSVLQHFIQYDI
jgi:hypothetical protein